MPSTPRPKGEARPATKAQQAALEAHPDAPEVPAGAALVDPPERGLWRALVDADGALVRIDGKPVRVP